MKKSLEYLDYSRKECHAAGLRYLRKNLKKGRQQNGCYSKCKSRKRVYKADLKQCIVQTDKLEQEEEKEEEVKEANPWHLRPDFDVENITKDLPKR